MVTDEEAEQAAEYIRGAARKIAKAKAERIHLHDYQKPLRAILAEQAEAKTVAAKDNYAYSHEKYIKLIQDHKHAVEEETKIYYLIEAQKAIIEIYKTQQYNNRMIDKTHR